MYQQWLLKVTNYTPGGHFLYYDLNTKEIKSLSLAPEGEGIITMVMDKERDQLYGLTWPKGLLIHHDINQEPFVI